MLESTARSGRTAVMTTTGLSSVCQRLSEHCVFITSSSLALLSEIHDESVARCSEVSWVLCWRGLMLRCSERADVVPAPPRRASLCPIPHLVWGSQRLKETEPWGELGLGDSSTNAVLEGSGIMETPHSAAEQVQLCLENSCGWC